MEREGRAAKTVTFFKKTTVTRWQHQSVAAAEGKDSVLMYLQHLSGDGRSDLLIIDLRFSGFNGFCIDVKNVVNTRMSMQCQLWVVHLLFCTVTNYTVICYPLWCSDIRVSQLQPYSLFQISAQLVVFSAVHFTVAGCLNSLKWFLWLGLRDWEAADHTGQPVANLALISTYLENNSFDLL